MKTRWILLCCLLVPVPARAALLLQDVLDRMEQKQQTLDDVSFEFVERIHQGNFPEQRITGKVQVKKPHALRVDQNAPDAQVLISDGDTFWLYSPAQQQQLKGDWKAWLKRSRFPLPLIDFVGTFTPEHWRRRYKVFYGGYTDKQYELRFKPLSANDVPITLWISEETFLPVKGKMDAEDTRIELELKALKTNTGLDPKLFVPKVPAGTAEVPITF